jgi:glucose-6-phosphate-specific signal transduction histidine kinase
MTDLSPFSAALVFLGCLVIGYHYGWSIWLVAAAFISFAIFLGTLTYPGFSEEREATFRAEAEKIKAETRKIEAETENEQARREYYRGVGR